MSNEKIFLTPRLEGDRFSDHTLPVNILEDFSALEELIFDLARKIYIEKNPERKRVPNHFTDNVYLKLSAIEEGSTVPIFVLSLLTSVTTPALTSQNDEYFQYFEAAKEKVFELVENINSGHSSDLNIRYLNYFNRFGRNLRDGEFIDLGNKETTLRNLKFDKNTRKKILLSRSEKLVYPERITKNVRIPQIDQRNDNFHIEIDGIIFECKLDRIYEETVLTAVQGYKKNTLVALKATGIYNENDKLVHVEQIESMDILHPFDVSVRLSELAKLEDKWYDGSEGKALNKDSLNLFEKTFYSNFTDSLPLPAIFPTTTGNILLEWKKENIEVSLEVALDSFTGTIYYFDMDDDDNDFETKIDVNLNEGWQTINGIVSKLIGNDE